MVLTFYWKISVVKIWESGKTYIRFMSFFNPQGEKKINLLLLNIVPIVD